MAHVNWREKPVRLKRTDHPVFQNQLEVGLPVELARELAMELAATFAPGGPELRIDLPENWTIYWKAKIGLSRLQLAHPQSDHWVATVHLTEDHANQLIQALRAIEGGQPHLVLSALGAMTPIVNFNLVIVAEQP